MYVWYEYMLIFILIIRTLDAGGGKTKMAYAQVNPHVKVADEVWIATAMLHKNHPERLGAHAMRKRVEQWISCPNDGQNETNPKQPTR